MQTQHGYDDTSKFLTQEQWDKATTEARSGFLKEGYVIKGDPMTATPRPKLDKQQAQHVVISVGKGVNVTGQLYYAGRYVNTHERAKTLIGEAVSYLSGIDTPRAERLVASFTDILTDMEG